MHNILYSHRQQYLWHTICLSDIQGTMYNTPIIHNFRQLIMQYTNGCRYVNTSLFQEILPYGHYEQLMFSTLYTWSPWMSKVFIRSTDYECTLKKIPAPLHGPIKFFTHSDLYLLIWLAWERCHKGQHSIYYTKILMRKLFLEATTLTHPLHKFWSSYNIIIPEHSHIIII